MSLCRPTCALLALALAGCSETFVGEGKDPVHTDTAGLDTSDTSSDTSEPDETGRPDDSGEPDDSGDSGTTGPVDADQDGVPAERDCDDGDATVYPGALELWYDGVDQDCDGNDDDQDGDGSPVQSDCDDADPRRKPGAAETWYDGVDQDCDGNDDDQDRDGSPFAADCDDVDATAYPGAREVWYDDVDEACDGGDDHDQDGDGDPAASGGGSDCDDLDPAAFTGATETLGDGADGDCDGGDDSPAMQSVDTFSASGMQGPRFGEISGYLILTFLADSLLYGSTVYTTGAGMHFLDAADPAAGSVSSSVWEWGSSYTFDDGLDFWADDDDWIWAYGLHAGATRYLVVDDYAVPSATWGNTVYSRSTSATFDDIELLEASDGSLHVIGCENSAGYLPWMHGAPGDFFLGRPDGSDDIAGGSGDACILWPSSSYVYVSRRSSGTMSVFSYSDSAGLTSAGTSSGWYVYDAKAHVSSGVDAWASAEGTYGVWAYLDGVSDTIVASDARTVAVSLDSTGRMYVIVADSSTTAWLYWGDPATGFDRVELDTGLPRVDDVDVHVADGDVVWVAVRGGNDLVVAAVAAP